MVRSLFPYEAPRKGQVDFLRDAREWLGEGGVLLAHAPTGLGKTAVALAAGLEAAQRVGKRVFFTTARRSQHRIAIETVRRIGRSRAPVPTVDLIARQAMCSGHESHASGEEEGVHAVARSLLRRPSHAQEAMRLASRFGVCPYRAAVAAMKGALLVVCDYSHLFDPNSDGVLRATGLHLRDIVCIVDEAHNLPSRSRQALSHRLTAKGLAYVASAQRLRSRRAARLAALSRLLSAEARFVGGDSRVSVEFLDRLLAQAPFRLGRRPSQRLARLLRATMSDLDGEGRLLAGGAVALLRRWERPDFIRLLSPQDGGSVLLSALDPRPATEAVFRELHAALLMSGTLHPGEMYVDLLGLDPERTRIRAYVPDFPPENRLLIATRHLSLSYRRRPEVFVPCAREIARLCRVIPGNVASFFPSYEVARRVGEALEAWPHPKRVLWEHRGQPKAVKEGLLQILEAAREGSGCLLMAVQGGSLSEGMDYPGNLLGGVIVAGLALSPPSLRVEALRAFYAARLGRRKGYEYAYLYPALNRAVQCAGRCIRSAEDVAAVVILDNRVLRPSYRSRLPRSFRPRPAGDPAADVRTFFYGGQHESARAPTPGRGGPDHANRMDGTAGGGEASRPEGIPPPDHRRGAPTGAPADGSPPFA